MSHRLALCGALLLIACDGGDAPADASTLVDAATLDATAGDAGPLDAGLPSTAVTLTYRGHTEILDQAWLGYTRVGGEITELYLELHRGGVDGCPTESSPSPDQTIVISGFEGTAPGTRELADGIRASFFDFEGIFREELAPASATESEIALTHVDLDAGEVVGTVALQFDEGSATGPIVAAHCASLDTDG